MTRFRIALLAGALIASAHRASAQTTFVVPDTAGWSRPQLDLLRFEQRRSDAIAKHDTTTLSAMYAPTFRGITAIGYVVDRDRLLRVFTLDDPTTVFTIDEIVITPLGKDIEAAVLTARLTTLRRSGEVVARSRFQHVYERRSGQWVIVAAQGTLQGTGS